MGDGAVYLQEPFCWRLITLSELYITGCVPIAHSMALSSNDRRIGRKCF